MRGKKKSTITISLLFFLIFFLPIYLFADYTEPVIYGVVPGIPPISFVDEDGNPSGYMVDLFTRIMVELEINYRIEVASYSEIYSKMLDGEIDLFTSMIKTDEREKLFYFPEHSMSGGWGQLFISLGSEFKSILSLRNKEIGMVKGDEIGQNFRVFMEQLSIPFTPVEFETFKQLVTEVQEGRLYGGVIYSTFLLGINGVKITPTVFSPQPAYPVTALNNDFIPTLNAIVDYMEVLKADENSYYYTLQKKWNLQNNSDNSPINSIIVICLLILAGVTGFLLLNGFLLKKVIQRRTGELEQAAIFFEHSIEGLMVTDKKLIITKVNKAFENITGYRAKDVMGKPITMLKSSDEFPEIMEDLKAGLEKNGKWTGKTWDRRKNGEVYPQHKSVVVIKDKNGEPYNYFFVFSDLTENKDLEERIHYISNYDKQTDLPNKTLFLDRLIMAGMNADRENNIICIISLGIDNFKKINRSFGHVKGDEILKKVGNRLKGVCRKSDTVSRYGGDEFTLLLTDINSHEDIIRIIEKIKVELERPFVLENNKIYTSCTQGISLYPSDSDDIKIIPRHANQAQHLAKKTGKGSYAFYKEENDILLKKRHKDETLLRSALEKDEILVHYQPKFDIKQNKITGVEALVRWKKNTGELIYPDNFISILEESGLIISIGEYVLKKSCIDISEVNQIIKEPLKLAVNLSGVQFSDPLLISKIMSILEQTGFPPELLEVEITESIAMDNRDNTLHILDELSSHGISIAVDDFGTGYSSLSYLQKFPLTTLKIDKSFIDDMDENIEDQGIVKTIISLAEIMKLNVVAEGVEKDSQIELLRDNNCHEAQGYLISKPTTLKKLKELMIKNNG